MELVRGLHNLRPRHRGCVLTIGAFDGVHRGHQEMIRQVRASALSHGVPAAALAFEPTPREYFAKSQPPARLTRFRERFEAFERYGVERFVFYRLTVEPLDHVEGNFPLPESPDLDLRAVVVVCFFKVRLQLRVRDEDFGFMQHIGEGIDCYFQRGVPLPDTMVNVGRGGVEPPRVSPPAPKAGASASFATYP